MLEEGRGARSFEAAESSLASLARIRGKSADSGRVVDAQVVLVPVAAMFVQPGVLSRLSV